MPKQQFRKKKQNMGYMKAPQKHEFFQDKKIEKIEKKVRHLAQEAELKYKDTLINVLAQDNGSLTLLNGISQGTTQVTRIGGQVRLTSLQYRLNFLSDTDIRNYVTARIIVFFDTQSNGADPVVSGNPLIAGQSGLLNTVAGGVPNNVFNPIQYENIDRFKIIHDKTFVLNPQQALTATTAGAVQSLTTTAVVARTMSKYHKISRTIKYDGAGATIADINRNSLYMLLISDQANIGAEGVSVFGVCRVYYKDM